VAQTCTVPLLTPVKLSALLIATGFNLLAVVPFPNWPLLLSPQQSIEPLSVVPQVDLAPALSVLSVELLGGIGNVLLTVVPLPSWPKVLSPQQYGKNMNVDMSVATYSKPQELLLPALISNIGRAATTWIGIELASVEPLPSWPKVLSPQQYAKSKPPKIGEAAPQLCRLPALKSKRRVGKTATATGVALLVVVPLPSWP
jgi:hypothetical protein